MKLAEALVLRADHQRRLDNLKQRLVRNAKVQEGDAPSEDPAELMAEIERAASDLTVLIQRINRTNASTYLADGTLVSDALAYRDVLKWRQSVYRELAEAASIGKDRYTRSEIRFQSAVNVPEIQRRADALAAEYRALDTTIQEMNWLAELVD